MNDFVTKFLIQSTAGRAAAKARTRDINSVFMYKSHYAEAIVRNIYLGTRTEHVYFSRVHLLFYGNSLRHAIVKILLHIAEVGTQ